MRNIWLSPGIVGGSGSDSCPLSDYMSLKETIYVYAHTGVLGLEKEVSAAI